MASDKILTTAQKIELQIRAALQPSVFEMNDESGKHEHHRGAREQPGAGHYEITIVSEAFEGKNRVARHRMIYDAVGELMQGAIHALKIDAKAPSELK